MEFWGVEVKAGQPLKVLPGDDRMIHLSQASLGESKKESGNDSVPLFLKFDDKKLVLGTLSSKNFPQISFDLVFEKEFELSHNWKNGSVYFCGYKADSPEEEGIHVDDSDSEEEVDLPINFAPNGKPEPKVETAKPATAKGNAAKPKVQQKPVEPKKDEKSEDDTDDSDESEDFSIVPADGDSVDSDDIDDSDDSDDDSDKSDEDIMSEDEETPKKAESGKKRQSESATKTPVPAKKVKLATPQKTDGKKGSAHTATPHPSKKAAKTPANSEKSKSATPKSAGPVTCNSCSKTFNSDGALQSHTKAKHEGK